MVLRSNMGQIWVENFPKTIKNKEVEHEKFSSESKTFQAWMLGRLEIKFLNIPNLQHNLLDIIKKCLFFLTSCIFHLHVKLFHA